MRTLNGHRPRWRGRPTAAFRRHLASVRRLWPRLSALKACMTSTASPSSAWTRPLSPSRLSRVENSVAVEAPLRAHSGELERASHCIADHQSSPTAPPCSGLQLPPSSSLWNPTVSQHFHSSPNRVAGTVFSGKPNAELLGVSRPLWLGSGVA